jgi:hypothetical protein
LVYHSGRRTATAGEGSCHCCLFGLLLLLPGLDLG